MAHLEVSKLFSVKGLVAVITGGGSGLGRTMARALEVNGASKVFIIGRQEQRLKETAASAISGSIIPVPGDVTSKESLQAAYDTIVSQTDHIDLLVANSAILGPSANPKSKPDGSKPTLSELRDHLWSIPMEEFTNISHVNVTGAFYTILAFLPLLEAANKKRPAPIPDIVSPPKPQIIITSSIAGFLRIAYCHVSYHLSKAAVTHMVKMLATTLVQYDIRVNGLAPGLYHSDMALPFYELYGVHGNGITDGSFPRDLIPITRGGSEEDMAGMILWMAGAAGGYLNGNIVVSDGGSLSIIPSTY
ncbi:short chain dehydrogenase/reductase family [Halenospora varia]|nr:short chain dehydrogenase/reductase family [Halenospora varia]